MSQWGSHISELQKFPKHNRYFNYHDYLESWSKIFLYQNKAFSHSWFVQFDHKFKSKIFYWFFRWWDQHGPVISLLPESLQHQVHNFGMTKFHTGTECIPIFLLFISKYKVPWKLKWKYHMASPVLTTAIHSSLASSSQVVVTHHSQFDTVTC